MPRTPRIRTVNTGRALWRRVVLGALAAVPLIFAACTPNQRIIESSRTPDPPPVVPTPVSSVESELQAMQIADFTYVLVFRRKDGGVMTTEDKSFINANTPPGVNRKSLTDGGRVVIIGSNFPFVSGSIEKLTDRFIMEDHSKSEAGPIEEDLAVNANSGQNSNRNRRPAAGSSETNSMKR